MSWITGSMNPERPVSVPPDLFDAILDVADAAFEQGRAAERGDKAAARQGAHEVFTAVNAALAAAEKRPGVYPHPGAGGGINT